MIDTKVFGSDQFNFDKKKLVEYKNCFDLTQETSCYGFVIEGTEPTGTKRKFIFKVDDAYYFFRLGVPTLFNYRIDFDNILEHGNSAAELLAITNISAWCGKKIYPVVAFYNSNSQLDATITKFALRVSSFNNIYSKVDYSPKFFLPNIKISSIDAQKFTTGNALLNVSASLLINNVWQDYEDVSLCKNKICDGFQLKAEHTLTRLDGVDSTKVNFTINYSDADNLVGQGTEIISRRNDLPDKFFDELDTEIYDDDIFPTRAEIHSVVDKSYIRTFDADPVTQADILQVLYGDSTFSDNPTSTCLVLLESLSDAEVFVSYYPDALHKTKNLGTGTGEVQQFTLTDAKINPETLQVQGAGKNIIPSAFDTETGKLFVKAAVGENIVATYDCGGEEDWLKLDELFAEDKLKCFVYRTTSQTTHAAVKILSAGVVDNFKLAWS